MRKRIIIEVDDGNEILAVRAAKLLLESDARDRISVFENSVEIYSRRTKSGVSARQSR